MHESQEAPPESTQIRWFSRQSDGEAVQCERWPKVTPEGSSGSSPLGSDGSRDGQVGRLDRVSGGQKTLNETA
jgi:hypothetical protein